MIKKNSGEGSRGDVAWANCPHPKKRGLSENDPKDFRPKMQHLGPETPILRKSRGKIETVSSP